MDIIATLDVLPSEYNAMLQSNQVKRTPQDYINKLII